MTDQANPDFAVPVAAEFTETLKSLARQSKSAEDADKAVKARATDHAPYALSALFGYADYSMTIDGWIAFACDACGDAGIRSSKGKRNALALREHGYTGLYNLAVSLKWLDDNMEEHGEALRSLFIEPFLRHDPDLQVARRYLFRSRDLTAIEAETADVETIRVMYDAAEGDKVRAEIGYWKDMGRPETFGALMKACQKYISEKVASGRDKTAEKLAVFVKFFDELETADIAAHEQDIAKALAAIERASKRLAESLVPADARGIGEVLDNVMAESLAA